MRGITTVALVVVVALGLWHVIPAPVHDEPALLQDMSQPVPWSAFHLGMWLVTQIQVSLCQYILRHFPLT